MSKAKQAKPVAAVKGSFTLSVSQAADVAKIITLSKQGEQGEVTIKAAITAQIKAIFPDLKTLRNRALYKAVMHALHHKQSGSTQAYRKAREAITAIFGGLPDKDGKILTAAVKKSKAKKGMTGGKFLKSMLGKALACVTYGDKTPEELVTPEMLEAITQMVSYMAKFAEVIEEYVEEDKAAAAAK